MYIYSAPDNILLTQSCLCSSKMSSNSCILWRHYALDAAKVIIINEINRTLAYLCSNQHKLFYFTANTLFIFNLSENILFYVQNYCKKNVKQNRVPHVWKRYWIPVIFEIFPFKLFNFIQNTQLHNWNKQRQRRSN